MHEPLAAGVAQVAFAILNTVLSLAVYLRWLVPCYQTPLPESSARSVRRVSAIAAALVMGRGLGVQLLLGQIG